MNENFIEQSNNSRRTLNVKGEKMKVFFRNHIWAIPANAFIGGLDVKSLSGLCLGCPENYSKITDNLKEDVLRRRHDGAWGGKVDTFWTLEQFEVCSSNANVEGEAVVLAMVPSKYGNAQSDIHLLHVGKYRLVERRAGSPEKLSQATFELV